MMHPLPLRHHRALYAACVTVSLHLLPVIAHAATSTTYVGPATGNWNTPANWSPAVVPANAGPNTYAVTVPDSRTLLFDLPAATVDSLSLGGINTTLNILPGNQLSVVGMLTAAGATLNVQGGTLSAPAPLTPTGNAPCILVTNTGQATLGLQQYTVGFRHDADRTLLSADGAGSLLNLSNVTTLDASGMQGWPNQFNYSVQATNGGTINLSGLVTAHGARGDIPWEWYSDDWLRFAVTSGSTLNLNSLTLTTGRVKFDVGPAASLTLPALLNMAATSSAASFVLAPASTLNFPQLQSLTSASFSLGDGSTFSAPNLTSLTSSDLTLTPGRTVTLGPVNNIDHSRLAANSGATLALPSVSSFTTAYRHDADRLLLSADGAGSLLNLSGMTSLDAWGMSSGNNDQNFSIQASNGGTVNLSGLTTVRGARGDTPWEWFSNDWLRFGVSAGSTLNLNALTQTTGRVKFDLGPSASLTLPALAAIGGTGVNAGAVSFVLGPSATLNLPVLQSVDSASFNLGDGSTFNAPNLTSITNSDLTVAPGRTLTLGPVNNITNSRLAAVGGTTLALPNVSSYTTSYRHDADRLLLSADGAGSLLNLSNVTSLDAWGMQSGNNDQNFSVQATNGGTVNLSALTTVRGTRGDVPWEWFSNDWLRFGVSAGSTLNLNALTQTTGRVKFDVGPAASLTLPALQTMVGSGIDAGAASFVVGTGATLNLPKLQSVDAATFNLGDGATLNAPLLTSITNSDLTRSPGRTLTLGPVNNITNSRLAAVGGTTLALPNVSSYTTSYRHDADRLLLSADGAGSLLNLSNVTSLDAWGMQSGNNDQNFSIQASNGGTVNLSGLATVRGARGDVPWEWFSNDWLRFGVSAGSTLNLNALTQTTGRVKFDLGPAASLTLPSLITTVGTGTDAGATAFVLGPSATLNLPLLQSVDSASFNLGDASNFNAPNLTSITNSDLTVAPGRTLTLGPVTNVNHSRLAAVAGATLSLPSVSSYTTSYRHDADRTLLSADGAGSLLDLSGMASLDAWGMQSGNNDQNFSIQATNGGRVDLSGVATVRGARGDVPWEWYSNDWLRFSAHTNGHVDLSSLRRVSARVKFEVGPAGRMTLGGASMDGTVRISLTDASAQLHTNDLWLWNDATLSAAQYATLSVAGSLAYSTQVETNLTLDRSYLRMSNTDGRRSLLEVGGEDLGLPGSLSSGNFGIGQLIVGAPGQPAVVQLIDVFNNGNRGAGNSTPESLYLFGINGGDGLVIHPGSSLNIGDINVYAFLDGAWVYLNSLFNSNTEVPLSDGVIRDIAFEFLAGDTAPFDGVVDLEDLNNVLNNFGDTTASPGDTAPFDGLVDLQDLNNVLNNFGASSASTTALMVVPEPSSLVCLLAAYPLLRRRPRMRKSECLPL